MMSRGQPFRRRSVLRRLGTGERLLALAMLAILAGGLGLIGQGLWLKATETAPLHSVAHSTAPHERSGPSSRAP